MLMVNKNRPSTSSGRVRPALSEIRPRHHSYEFWRAKEDYSRERAGLMGCTGPKIDKVEGSSSLPRLPNQN